jgi:hypothetical protein
MRVDTKPQGARGDAVSVRQCDPRSASVSLREDTLSFEPTRQDLKLVQGYLEREIKRLQKRHAEITRTLGQRDL